MRKILTLLLLLVSYASIGQINPTNGTVSNKSYSPAQSVSTDFRSWFYDGVNFVMRDYNGTSEVISYLNLSKYRSGHFPIFIHSGGTLNGNGTYTGGVTLAYWFKDGTADGNLVRWYTDSTIVTPKVDTVYRKNDSVIGFTIDHGPERTFIIRGTAAGGSISSLVFNAPGSIFNTPINFSNTSGAWSGSMTLLNQNPNSFLAGPSIGGAAQPTFRQLTTADLPTGIPNGNLLNSSISFSIGASGTSPNWSSTSPALGGSTILNIPTTSASATGIVTPTLWNFWNQKVDSTIMSNDSVYEWRNGTRFYRYLIVGGGASVTSVSNSDGSLTISPTTGGVIASLTTSHVNTWTGSAQVFNGGISMGGPITFQADNTYSIGTSSAAANAVYTRFVNSTGALAFKSAAASAINFFTDNGTGGAAMILQSNGQLQLSKYTTSTSYTGTPLSYLQSDGSGNVIQIPVASVQGALTLTTTGSSGAATLVGTILNIPQYSGGGGGCLNCNADSLKKYPVDTTLRRNGYALTFDSLNHKWVLAPNGSGTVTSFSFTNVNGFAGSVTNSTTTPSLTLSTSITGLLFGNGTALGAATVSTPLTYSAGTLGIQVANTSQNGYLTSTDWNTFNGKQNALTLTTIGSSGAATLIGATLNIPQYAGGGGGITQIKARNPLFTVGTDSIALDTLRAPEIPYGNIYTRNGTFSANELVAVGNAAFTVNAAGNVVVTSGNSGINANYIRLQNIVDEVTQLPRFSRTMYFQANGTGTGIAVGTVKTGVRQSVGDVAAWVNLAASPLQFAIGNTSPTILTNSGSYVNGPTWTTGDSIKVVLTFSDSVAVATVQNVTTNSAVTTLTYNFVTSSSPFLPQISYWAWITFGGQQTIYSEADSSASVKDPNELLAGTSKTAAYYATNFANRLGWQVGQSVPSSVISAGGSNMTNDYSRVFPQNLNQNPIYFLIEEPCNDIRVGYGGSLAQAEKTVDSMITVCKTRGIKFLLYGLPEDSTVTGPAGNAAVGLTVMDLYFRNKYPQNYINTWDSLVVTPGSDNRLKTAYYITDGIHPNGAAQTVIARIIARSLTYYKNRQANILNTDGLIQVSNGGYASLNAKAVAAAIVGGGTVNVLPKYLASGGLTPSGFSDDGSTEFGAGSWYTTPVLKAGPSHAVTASLYTMSFGSSFTNWYTRMPGGGTNDKIWGFNNNGGTFSGAKLTDGGSAAFTWLNVASSGTTLSTIALQGRTLINGATDDASTGLQIAGGGRADKLGINTAPVTDSWLILAAGTTSVSPIRLTVGPLKTTTFGGTILYGSGADTSLYVGITRNALNVLTRVALVDSSAILTGQIAFANSSRYYTGDNNFKYTVAAGMVLGNNLQLSAIVRKLLDTTTYKPTVVDGSGNMFKTDWATFGGGSQTWQQGLTTGSTLNTTNTVTNTGQSFTWNNGGTGTFKLSGILTDTVNAAYVLFKKKDSSVAEMTFANLGTYLPSDTTIGMNGITINANASGTRDTITWNGTLSQNTTIAQAGFSASFTGGQFVLGVAAGTRNWNPSAAIPGSPISLLPGILNDNVTSSSGTVTNAYVIGITTPTLTATNTGVTTTNAFTFYINGAPFASTNETITNSYALGVNGPALFQNQLSTGSIAFDSWQTATSGTSVTINNVQTNFLFNPASLTATYTINLPAAPDEGQLVKIHFGGTLASGVTVVTSLTISPNSGQSIEQTVAPITAVGGDCFIYQFNKSTSAWYREK